MLYRYCSYQGEQVRAAQGPIPPLHYVCNKKHLRIQETKHSRHTLLPGLHNLLELDEKPTSKIYTTSMSYSEAKTKYKWQTLHLGCQGNDVCHKLNREV